MRKIRILLIVLFVFLLSGCSGNYNLTLNEDLTIKEELDISIKNENDNYEKTYNIFEKADIDSNKYEIYTDEDNVYINYSEEYGTLEDYLLNSNLYRMLFENIEYEKDNTGMKLNTEANFKLDDIGSNEIVNAYDIDDLKINIKTPFIISKSNADSIKDNTLTWILNNNDTSKEIDFVLSYKKASTLSIVLILLLGGAIVAFLVFIIINLVRRNKI